MDVDLDESCGLSGCIRGAFDADALQFYETNDAGLGRFQLPEQIVHRDVARRGLLLILDRYFVVERLDRVP